MRIAVHVAAALVLLAAACGPRHVGSRRPERPGSSTVAMGDCADFGRDGVLGQEPDLERADRDLDGDGVRELVTNDRQLCTSEGNCYWNVFTSEERGGCRRYLGTIEAMGIEPLSERGEDGFRDLRGWWQLGQGRYLLQRYRFQAGGYRVIDALVCSQHQQGDDRLLCAEDRR